MLEHSLLFVIYNQAYTKAIIDTTVFRLTLIRFSNKCRVRLSKLFFSSYLEFGSSKMCWLVLLARNSLQDFPPTFKSHLL